MQIYNNDKLLRDFSIIIERLIKGLTILERKEKVCCGVTMSQCYVIEKLFNKSSLSMSELSIELGLAISTLTRIIDILERDGIIIRLTSADDRRKVLISLSEKGKSLAKQVRECSDKYSIEILKYIPPEKCDTVIECLNIFNDAIENARTNCCK